MIKSFFCDSGARVGGSGGIRRALRQGRRALSTSCAAAALLAFSALQAMAEYTLQAGDVLRVIVPGMTDFNTAAAIDNDGMLRLGPFAPVPAAGGDLASVETLLRAAAAQMVTRRYDATGAVSFVPVPADDLRVTVDAYRPIHVYGAVRTPGASPFRPGLTVRAALAGAGGASTIVDGQRALDGAATERAQTDFSTLTLERARLIATIWRLQASLGMASADTPPDGAALGVGARSAEALLNAQRRLIETLDAQREAEIAFLKSAVAQTESRIAILTEQTARQADAVAADEEELTRVTQLLSRGVVPKDRLLDIRRAQVLSATRLLDIENDLERVKFDRIRFAADLQTAESRRRERLLGELATAQARLEEVAVRLDAARNQLALRGVAPIAALGAGVALPDVQIHRGVGALAFTLNPQLDDYVEPGDVIEVTITFVED